MPDTRMYAPSPTVASSPVPYYLRGNAPGLFNPHDRHTAALIDAGIDPDTADLIFGAVANGQISKKQFEEIVSGNMSQDDLHHLLFGVVGNQLPTGSGEPLISILETALSGLGQDDPLIDSMDTVPIDYTSPNIFEVAAGIPSIPTNYVMQSSQSPISPSDYVVSPDGTTVHDLLTNTTIDTQTGNVFDSSGNVIWPGSGPIIATAAVGPGKSVQGSTATQIAAAAASALKQLPAGTIGPAPRISTTIPSTASLLSRSSIVKGVPDFAVIGLGVIGLIALSGKR